MVLSIFIARKIAGPSTGNSTRCHSWSPDKLYCKFLEEKNQMSFTVVTDITLVVFGISCPITPIIPVASIVEFLC